MNELTPHTSLQKYEYKLSESKRKGRVSSISIANNQGDLPLLFGETDVERFLAVIISTMGVKLVPKDGFCLTDHYNALNTRRSCKKKYLYYFTMKLCLK